MFLQTNLEYIMHVRRTNPRHDTLKKLADWAGVTVSDLVEKAGPA